MDPDQLLALAKNRSHGGRAALSQAVSTMLVDEGLANRPIERRLILEILSRIVRDIEIPVRRQLSALLAKADDAPPQLVRDLANDTIEIAYPILAHSPLLSDPDLLAVIRAHAAEHQMAIASRAAISEEVSNALIAAGDVTVVRRLLENRGAAISEASLTRLVEDSRRIEIYREPLLKRPTLPPALARRMFVWVSAALRQYILENYGLGNVFLEDAAFEAGRRALSEHEDDAHRTDDLPFPVSVLLETLAEGHVFQFVAIMRQLTGLKEVLLLRVLAETSGQGLAVLFRALGLDRKGFSTVFALIRRIRGESAQDTPAARDRAEAFFERLTRDGARATVLAWRKGKDYQAALRDIRLN